MVRRTAPALALLAALLTGCASSDDPATRASQDSGGDFCAEYGAGMKAVMGADSQDVDAAVEAMQAWAEVMRPIEPPADMPPEARRGIEVIFTEIEALDPGATEKEFESLGDDLGQQAKQDVRAFGRWAVKGCPGAVEEAMGDVELGGG